MWRGDLAFCHRNVRIAQVAPGKGSWHEFC
jgi:hypothetical protein